MSLTRVLHDSRHGLASKEALHRAFNVGIQRFADFERFYRAVRGQGRRYLGDRAREYRGEVALLQDLIEPAVRSECWRCKTMCCRLDIPELAIYTAPTIGCYGLVDYLLARCDSDLPTPRYESVHDNLCPFWDGGCTIARDQRSLVCLRYFCGALNAHINHHEVLVRLERLSSLVKSLSLLACLDVHE